MSILDKIEKNTQGISMTYIIFFLALIGYITGQMAKKQGKNVSFWSFIGFFFGLFGLLAFLFLIHQEKKGNKKEAITPLLPITNGDESLWYFVCEKKKQNGPYSFHALSDKYHKGMIDLSTYVWNESMDQWKMIKELME